MIPLDPILTSLRAHGLSPISCILSERRINHRHGLSPCLRAILPRSCHGLSPILRDLAMNTVENAWQSMLPEE
jgi:hypothetical protein